MSGAPRTSFPPTTFPARIALFILLLNCLPAALLNSFIKSLVSGKSALDKAIKGSLKLDTTANGRYASRIATFVVSNAPLANGFLI